MKRLMPVCVFIFLVTNLVMASEPTTPEENNPLTNDAANACFIGGTWEGRCGNVDVDRDGIVEQWESEYMYTVGWYLIRFEFGIISREDFPLLYIWALPPRPEPVTDVTSTGSSGSSGAGCYDNAVFPYMMLYIPAYRM